MFVGGVEFCLVCGATVSNNSQIQSSPLPGADSYESGAVHPRYYPGPDRQGEEEEPDSPPGYHEQGDSFQYGETSASNSGR